jgi:hypothetical protein
MGESADSQIVIGDACGGRRQPGASTTSGRPAAGQRARSPSRWRAIGQSIGLAGQRRLAGLADHGGRPRPYVGRVAGGAGAGQSINVMERRRRRDCRARAGQARPSSAITVAAPWLAPRPTGRLGGDAAAVMMRR